MVLQLEKPLAVDRARKKEGLHQMRAMSIGTSVWLTSFPTAEWWRAVFTNGEGYHISGIRWRVCDVLSEMVVSLITGLRRPIFKDYEIVEGMLVQSLCMCRAKECEVTQILGWHRLMLGLSRSCGSQYLLSSLRCRRGRGCQTVRHVFPIVRLSLLVTVGLYICTRVQYRGESYVRIVCQALP